MIVVVVVVVVVDDDDGDLELMEEDRKKRKEKKRKNKVSFSFFSYGCYIVVVALVEKKRKKMRREFLPSIRQTEPPSLAPPSVVGCFASRDRSRVVITSMNIKTVGLLVGWLLIVIVDNNNGWFSLSVLVRCRSLRRIWRNNLANT